MQGCVPWLFSVVSEMSSGVAVLPPPLLRTLVKVWSSRVGCRTCTVLCCTAGAALNCADVLPPWLRLNSGTFESWPQGHGATAGGGRAGRAGPHEAEVGRPQQQHREGAQPVSGAGAHWDWDTPVADLLPAVARGGRGDRSRRREPASGLAWLKASDELRHAPGHTCQAWRHRSPERTGKGAM